VRFPALAQLPPFPYQAYDHDHHRPCPFWLLSSPGAAVSTGFATGADAIPGRFHSRYRHFHKPFNIIEILVARCANHDRRVYLPARPCATNPVHYSRVAGNVAKQNTWLIAEIVETT
jgi:hypothetical protein